MLILVFHFTKSLTNVANPKQRCYNATTFLAIHNGSEITGTAQALARAPDACNFGKCWGAKPKVAKLFWSALSLGARILL